MQSPAALPGLTRETKPAERAVNGGAPRRPRESKKEAVSLCSRGGMRKCPRSVSNLSEGGQATFSRRGKASRAGAHTGERGRGCRGLPGYMEEKKEEEERRESKESVVSEAVSRVCLCPLTPPSYTLSASTRRAAVRVCVSFRSAPLHLLLLLLLLHQHHLTPSSSSSLV